MSRQNQSPVNASTAPRVPENVSTQPDKNAGVVVDLQRTIGNAATQRMLHSGAMRGNIAAFQALIGNVRAQRVLTRTPTGQLQRVLDFNIDSLIQEKDKSLDAMTGALAKYWLNGDAHFKEKARRLSKLIAIVDRWLGDHRKMKQGDENKRANIETLRSRAFEERLRVIVCGEVGVPSQIVDTFARPVLDKFFAIAVALEDKNASQAFALFQQNAAHLGDASTLVKQFMVRNHIHTFNPALAASMDNPKYKMDPKQGAGAQQLIVDEARGKLKRLDELKQAHDQQLAAYRANQKPDKKLTDYPLLDKDSKENLEMGLLNLQRTDYEGIISGKTIKSKNEKKEFADLSEAELYGIVGYTSNLYSTINTGMRNRAGDRNQFAGAHVELAGAITSGLNKLKPYKGRTYRHNGDFAGFASVNVSGATVIEIAPTSTAIEQKSCANAGEQHAVLEVFESITGRDVSAASLFSKEAEVMFAPGARFKVTAAFTRQQSAWNTPHHEDQYKVNGQESHPAFAEAMKLAADDSKNAAFHRIIFKQEIKA